MLIFMAKMQIFSILKYKSTMEPLGLKYLFIQLNKISYCQSFQFMFIFYMFI